MRKTICRSIFTATLASSLAILLAACVVQTEGETDETATIVAESMPVVAESESAISEPEEIVVPEIVISANPGKIRPLRTLKVGSDLASAVVSVIDKDGEVLEELKASDCGDSDEDYYVCSFRLPVGEYTVEFSNVDRYEAPESIEVNLKWGGTMVYGSYAEDPTAPELVRPNVGLPGIGEPPLAY